MEGMSMPQIVRHAPYFPVKDVAHTASDYERCFGFKTEYAGGSPPEFAIVSRDGLAIMLRRVGDASLIRPSESQGGTWDAFFWVDDVDPLFEEFRDRGASIVYEPTMMPYGVKEFAVRDSDGHVLGFGR
jgi:predicted enzyme related to lactoylglutathione lyase